MFRFVATLLAVTALVSGSALPARLRRLRPDGRIVGGEQVRIEDNPWQVSLVALGFHNCGGIIIAPDVILTAAHCMDGLLSLFYEVVSGTDDLQNAATRSSISRSLVHSGYDGLSNDAALIFLNEPLTFNERTQAIPLADEDPAVGESARVTGWGLLDEGGILSPNILNGVDVDIVDREQCAAAYNDVQGAYVDDTMVCAAVAGGGKDACSGDSGGPLSKNGVLIGIVSWGLGCARADYPGVYTSVPAIREWIRENAGV